MTHPGILDASPVLRTPYTNFRNTLCYLKLQQSQKGGVDIPAWLEWFLGCLGRAIAGAETGLAVVLKKARTWEKSDIIKNPNFRGKSQCWLHQIYNEVNVNVYNFYSIQHNYFKFPW